MITLGVTLAAGYLLSYLFPTPDQEAILPLTVWARTQADVPEAVPTLQT